ncbi:uncharacterized protein LOC135831825 [Planococcus citri]|uniref:uncharacterized protein LOC135831825 n=1 Tax=Planococcus citri TaxID=170843 RepID=UPI0031F82507
MRISFRRCLICGRRGNSGFFGFPKNPTRRKLWKDKCNLSASFRVNSSMKLCFVHFEYRDIVVTSTRITLKRSAVPITTVVNQRISPDARRLDTSDQVPSWFVEVEPDSAEDDDEEEVRFVSSSTPGNVTCTIKIDDEDEYQEPNSDDSECDNEETETIDLTDADENCVDNVDVLLYLDTVRKECGKNLEVIDQLKQEKTEIKEKYENLLNSLLKKKSISKDGRKIIENFRTTHRNQK